MKIKKNDTIVVITGKDKGTQGKVERVYPKSSKLLVPTLNKYKKSMKKLGYKILPTGCIVGMAEIVGVKKYKDENQFANDRNKHLATGDWGKYGFIIKNAERVKQVPAKGSLNFWEYKKWHL